MYANPTRPFSGNAPILKLLGLQRHVTLTILKHSACHTPSLCVSLCLSFSMFLIMSLFLCVSLCLFLCVSHCLPLKLIMNNYIVTVPNAGVVAVLCVVVPVIHVVVPILLHLVLTLEVEEEEVL